MAENLPFEENKKSELIVTSETLDYLIPSDYFRKPFVAEIQENKVSTLLTGIILRDEKDQRWTLNAPIRSTLRYSEMGVEDDMKRFSLSKGEVFLESTINIQSAQNVFDFFRALLGARLQGVEYTDLVKVFLASSELNATSPGVSRPVLEAMIANLARYSGDMRIPYRIALGEKKAKEGEFTLAKIKDVPALESTFGALAFEDIVKATQRSIVRNIEGAEERPSPMEEIVRI